MPLTTDDATSRHDYACGTMEAPARGVRRPRGRSRTPSRCCASRRSRSSSGCCSRTGTARAGGRDRVRACRDHRPGRRLPGAPVARRVRVRQGGGSSRRPAHDRHGGRHARRARPAAVGRSRHPPPRPRARRRLQARRPRGFELEVSMLGKVGDLGPLRLDLPRARDERGNVVAARALLDQPRARGARRRAVRRSRRAAKCGADARPRVVCRDGSAPAGRSRHRGAKPQAEVDPSLRCSRHEPRRKGTVDTLPDLQSLSDDELSALLAQIEEREEEISRRRRVLHGRIDILRAERTSRLKAQVPAGASTRRRRPRSSGRSSRAPATCRRRRSSSRSTSRAWTTTSSGQRSASSRRRRTTSR